MFFLWDFVNNFFCYSMLKWTNLHIFQWNQCLICFIAFTDVYVGACLFGFELLQSWVTALFVAGIYRSFFICFRVHYWYFQITKLILIYTLHIILNLIAILVPSIVFLQVSWPLYKLCSGGFSIVGGCYHTPLFSCEPFDCKERCTWEHCGSPQRGI